MCEGCATGCNDEVHHARGKIYRLVPRENHDVNQFWMCDEGRFTYKEIDNARVAAPRIGGETTSMDKALTFAAERLAGVPRELLGVVLNAQATNEDNYLLAKVAKALGITHVYLAGRPPKPERADDILRSADVNPNTAGARLIANVVGKAKGTQQLNADIAAGSVRGLWILGDHVALDDEALAALGKLDVVYQSPHDNFLSDKVSVLLPASSWAEVNGTFTNAKGLVQRVRAAVEPPGEARPHHELVALIAKRLGVDVGTPTPKALFAEMKGAVPDVRQRELRARGAADPTSFRGFERLTRMGLILLFLIPAAAFAGMSVALVGVIGFVLPWIGSHSWGAWAMDPWFQALVKLALLILVVVMPIASLLTWMERSSRR